MKTREPVIERYSEFIKIVDLISAQNSLQRKQINKFIHGQGPDYWQYANEISQVLDRSFLKSERQRAEAASSYNRMSMDFLREQIRFSKTGVYCRNDLNRAKEHVYNRPDVMRYYMVGLLLSYFLWPNHFQILCFLREHVKGLSVERHLDIAPGHGLFVVETLKQNPVAKSTLLDISKTSLQITSELLAAFEFDASRFSFINGDFLSVSIVEEDFDFISMGEVLEHVDDPLSFLKRARDLLRQQGTIFMSTCANCPAIDHVYHFHNPEDIRSLIRAAGLIVVKEKVLPVEALPKEQRQQGLEASNYCAILVKE